MGDLIKGVGTLEGLQHSDDTATTLATIRDAIAQLEYTAGEHRRWAQLFSAGGPLLFVQACQCALHDDLPEWLVGQFFIGEHGFVFESKDVNLRRVGPVLWQDVQ